MADAVSPKPTNPSASTKPSTEPDDRNGGVLHNAFQSPTSEVKIVAAGEYDNLLQRYTDIAKKMGIDKPPPLKIVMSSEIGDGAHGALTGVSISKSVVDLLTTKEMNDMLAHELGHVKDQIEKKSFADWKDSEISADTRAIKVTHDPDSAISGLTKIAAAQTKELGEKLRKLLSDKPPEEIEKSLGALKKAEDTMLTWRIAGIKKAAAAR